MKKRKTNLWRGLGVLFAFLCAFIFGAYNIASGDYKTQVDDALSAGGTAGSTDAGAYAFKSDYQNTTQMLTERRRIAETLAEEGCVLLKNENGALPLRADAQDESELRVTLLGSRAYTYDSTGKLRDTGAASGANGYEGLSTYAGVVGSHMHQQRVTTNDGVFDLPITLEAALKQQNIAIDPKTKKSYDSKAFPRGAVGSEANGSEGGAYCADEPKITRSECGTDYGDAAIVFIGRTSGEGREYIPGEKGVDSTSRIDGGQTGALGLSDNERALIRLAGELSDKVIVLLNSAVPMDINDLKEGEIADTVDSVLWIGLPGLYGMSGVAALLSGEASPSGHLPDVWAVDSSYSPAAQNFSTQAQDGTRFAWANRGAVSGIDWRASTEHYVALAEGLYTGYRYYETRYCDSVFNRYQANTATGSSTLDGWKYENEVTYPFGYGLSYGDFTEEIVDGSLRIDLTEKTYSVKVQVTNNGTATAKHAVQLYVQAPYTEYDRTRGVEKSAIQLLDFEKVELQAGESRQIEISGDLKYVASYDETATHDNVTGGYTLERGKYYFAIGNGAHEALNNALFKSGEVSLSSLYREGDAPVNEKGAAVWDSDAGGLDVDRDGVNASLFSKTSEGGAIVRNQMADADYNYYKNNTVTYLTRAKWSDTFPKAYTSLEVTADMRDALNSDVYTVNANSSQEMPVFGYDHADDEDDEGNPLENKTVAELKLKAFDDEEWEYLLDQVTFHEAWQLAPYGGTSNAPLSSVSSPEAWQIDGPAGNISRGIGAKSKSGPYNVAKNDPNYSYYSCDMPCEPIIAATFDKELIKEEGKIFGEDFIWSGNAMIWAPGMNLHRCPFNARAHEYYSEDPMLTNLCGAAMIEGGLEKGAILAAKHFAFNTQESNREGLCQFMEEQSARELELRGYEGIVEDVNYVNAAGNQTNALGLMTSFSRVGATSVNAHTGVMKNILRGEWGFKGLSSTDMVITGAYFVPEDCVVNNVTFMATSSGDSLLRSFWTEWNNEALVAKDSIVCNALRENMHYYLYALANSSALNGIDSSFAVVEKMSWWQTALICVGAGLGVLSGGAFAMYVFNVVKNNRNKEGGKDE